MSPLAAAVQAAIGLPFPIDERDLAKLRALKLPADDIDALTLVAMEVGEIVGLHVPRVEAAGVLALLRAGEEPA